MKFTKPTLSPKTNKYRMDALEHWRIAKVIPHIKGRLLDLGCGFNNLVKAYGSGCGVDVFPWKGIDALIGNSTQLPFPNETFDTVTIVAALNHIPNRREALREVRRVLRADGRLILTMIGPGTGIIAHKLFARDEHVRGRMHPDEKLGMRRQEVLNVLEEGGFRVVRQVPFEFGLNRVYIAARSSQREISHEGNSQSHQEIIGGHPGL